MTNPDKLEALAGRVEALTGPDREVDADVAVAMRWSPPGIDERLFFDSKIRPLYAYRVPRYTASLDAALTLLDNYRQYDPDQCGFAPSVARSHDGTGIADVHISPYGEMVCAKAATPALALCAAALRALRARTLHPLSSDTEGMVK